MTAPIVRYVINCRVVGCPNFCTTSDRDPKVWTCPTCEDLQLEEHVRYMDALNLTRSPRHHTPTKESLAS
jgi:hypothetical protein